MFTYNKDMAIFQSICLNLTDACPLACKYCFVHQNPHYMTLKTAKDALKYLHNNLIKLDKLHPDRAPHTGLVTYFGGEPTLCWDSIIVPLTKWAEKTYPGKFHFSITTNGVLLNKERIDFLSEHRINPLLSIDGDKETQDHNRPMHSGESSYDKVAANIPYLLEKFPMTTFRATIDQEMCHKVFDAYKTAIDLGFKFFFITPNCRELWSNENKEILRQEVQKIYTHFLCNMLNDEEPLDFKMIKEGFEMVLRRDLEIYQHEENATTIERGVRRCGLGTTTASIGYDGNIYGCQEQDSYAGVEGKFYMGNIYTGIDYEKHEKLVRDYAVVAKTTCEIPENCGDCPIRTLCQEIGCPSVNWDRFQSFHVLPDILCYWTRIWYECAIPIMEVLTGMNVKKFKDYLYNNCNYQLYWKEEDYYGLSKL